MKNLLSPEVQLKAFFKKKIPTFKNDILTIIESLLLQVADQTESNPFELLLIVSKRDDIALGRIFDAEQKCLETMNVGDVMADVFNQQLEQFDPLIKELILQQSEGFEFQKELVESLKNKSILIQYGEGEQEDDLIFTEVTKTGKKVIDLDEFISTLDL